MKLAATLLAAALLLAPLAAPAMARERPWKGGPAHFFVEPEVGAYLPGDGAIRDLYDAGNLFLGLRVGVLFESGSIELWPDRPVAGTLALFAEGGYWRDEGRERLAPRPELTLHLVPTTLGVEYAFRYREEPLLVPFLGAGFDTFYFREEVRLAPKEVTQGVRFGWHGEAGLRLLLDGFDPAAAASFRRHAGVRNTWASLRGRYQNVAGFDEGIDLSGFTVDYSFVFEF